MKLQKFKENSKILKGKS